MPVFIGFLFLQEYDILKTIKQGYPLLGLPVVVVILIVISAGTYIFCIIRVNSSRCNSLNLVANDLVEVDNIVIVVDGST